MLSQESLKMKEEGKRESGGNVTMFEKVQNDRIWEGLNSTVAGFEDWGGSL